eukprot:TRINITY_DN4810_c0_g1_i1.p1 TRINITY_DN4810_c0_g1~~TRINITY_DN4810_c0_g1_i1.p1  ORF type:complete len:545 (+),score=145.74 TRINITY_DN4810_c0_g1_i1:81-1715(+)
MCCVSLFLTLSFTAPSLFTLQEDIRATVEKSGTQDARRIFGSRVVGTKRRQRLDRFIEYLGSVFRYTKGSKKDCSPEFPCVKATEFCAGYDDHENVMGRCILKPDNFCRNNNDCKNPGEVCNADSDDDSGVCISGTGMSGADVASLKPLVERTKVVGMTSIKSDLTESNLNTGAANAMNKRYAEMTPKQADDLATASALQVNAQIAAHASPSTPACGNGFCDNPEMRAKFKFGKRTKLKLVMRVHVLKGSISLSKVKKSVKETTRFFKRYKIYIDSEIRVFENEFLQGKKIAKAYDLLQADRCTPEESASADGEVAEPTYTNCVEEVKYATIANSHWRYDQAINVFIGDQAKDSRLGFAKFPWNGQLHGLVFLSKDAMGKKLGQRYGYTFAHELGHALGLLHTHQGQKYEDGCGRCGENYDQTGEQRDVAGDFCSDTPPTPKNFDCTTPDGMDVCTNKEWKNTAYKNLMGYSKGCRYQLTKQQLARIRCWAYNGHRYLTKCRSLPDRDMVRYQCGTKDAEGNVLGEHTSVVRDGVTGALDARDK